MSLIPAIYSDRPACGHRQGSSAAACTDPLSQLLPAGLFEKFGTSSNAREDVRGVALKNKSHAQLDSRVDDKEGDVKTLSTLR